MIDEMEDEDAEETHGNSLNLLSADDAARLTEMLVSVQNNCNPQQDLVLTGSIRSQPAVFTRNKHFYSVICWGKEGRKGH